MTTRNIRLRHRERYLPFGIDPTMRPYISCTLSTDRESLTVLALVDSGADGCRFPLSVGEALGFDFSDDPGELSAGFGGPTIVYRRTLMLTFAGRTFPVEARFDRGASDRQTVIGRQGFFTRFFVGFEETQRAVYFDPL